MTGYNLYAFDPTCVFEPGFAIISLIQFIDINPGFLGNWYIKPWTTHLKFEHLSRIFQDPTWAWQAIKDLVTFSIIQPMCT